MFLLLSVLLITHRQVPWYRHVYVRRQMQVLVGDDEIRENPELGILNADWGGHKEEFSIKVRMEYDDWFMLTFQMS